MLIKLDLMPASEGRAAPRAARPLPRRTAARGTARSCDARAGPPDRQTRSGEVVHRYQAAGIELGAKQDRRADRDAVPCHGGGDVQVFGGEGRAEASRRRCLRGATRPVPERPPVRAAEQRHVRRSSRIGQGDSRCIQQRRGAERHEHAREQLHGAQSRPVAVAVADISWSQAAYSSALFRSTASRKCGFLMAESTRSTGRLKRFCRPSSNPKYLSA